MTDIEGGDLFFPGPNLSLKFEPIRSAILVTLIQNENGWSIQMSCFQSARNSINTVHS